MIEIPISAPVIPSITSGFTFTPRVSSSKNLNSPALDAGNGAFFFFPSPNVNAIRHSSLKYIPLCSVIILECLMVHLRNLIFSNILR